MVQSRGIFIAINHQVFSKIVSSATHRICFPKVAFTNSPRLLSNVALLRCHETLFLFWTLVSLGNRRPPQIACLPCCHEDRWIRAFRVTGAYGLPCNLSLASCIKRPSDTSGNQYRRFLKRNKVTLYRDLLSSRKRQY
jgi:hypothetical protein